MVVVANKTRQNSLEYAHTSAAELKPIEKMKLFLERITAYNEVLWFKHSNKNFSGMLEGFQDELGIVDDKQALVF